MADSAKKEKVAKKPSFWKGLKSEFKKITWPTKKDVMKQTVVVAIISVIVGLLIAGIDLLIKYGMDFLTHLSV